MLNWSFAVHVCVKIVKQWRGKIDIETAAFIVCFANYFNGHFFVETFRVHLRFCAVRTKRDAKREPRVS